MRVLITGGTGFVGHHVTAALVAAGHDVTVLSRSGGQSRAASGKDLALVPGARYVTGNVADGSGLREAAHGSDAVAHLVGIIAPRGGQDFEAAHVSGTRHALEAASAAGARHFLHMSALGARRDSPSGYARSKAEAEDLVRQSGLPHTIFRPSLVFGPGDDFFGRVLRNLVSQAPVVPVIGHGRYPFRPVSALDVADAFVNSLGNPAALGRSFDLTGPREYTFRELLELELRALGKRKPLVSVPVALMNLVVPVMQALPSPPITRDQYAMLLEGSSADPAPARDALRLFLRGLEEALPSILGRAG
ncbi:MAG TPA: complex I NDUFA9 subunit family protein [Deinococcales bacterium]|nr:complex I NDUFA9 subunit family protein [Deinococcales bacterium]